MLGIAGASFAVALPLASRWYPPQYQGLAMGIAGAGNSGTLLATLFAPRLAERYGWASTLGMAILPLLAVFLLFVLMARDSPKRPAPATLARLRRVCCASRIHCRWPFSTASRSAASSGWPASCPPTSTSSTTSRGWQPAMSPRSSSSREVCCGRLAAGCRIALAGIGCWSTLLTGFAVCLGFVAAGVTLRPAVALFFVGLGMLGMGNGAVFQLVPQRFPERIGLVTGIVGAAGGLGGFFLPSVLGAMRDSYGTYAPGLVLFTTAFVARNLVLLELGNRWSRRWSETAVRQTGVYSYRATFRGALVEEP